MDEHLKAYLGVEKVIWVKEGIDPEETNGHIDDVATFIAPGVMVCIWTDDEDYPSTASAMRPTRPEQRHRREGPCAEGVQAAHAGEAPVHGPGLLRHHRHGRERRAARGRRAASPPT